MFKNVWLLPLLTLAFTLGLPFVCQAEYSLATNEQEYLLFSTASEVKLGQNLALKIESKFDFFNDEQLQERLDKIGQDLAAVCDRKDIIYCFRAIKGERANAFALPGGYIYVHQGLLDKLDSDDEIAAVLAHELGHIVCRHSVKRLQSALGYNLLSILTFAATKDLRFKRGTDMAFGQIMLGYSREDELMADKLAVKYLRKAGYNALAAVSVLEKLKQIEKEAPLRGLIPAYARTHPFLPERIARIREEIYGKMDFKDYININN